MSTRGHGNGIAQRRQKLVSRAALERDRLSGMARPWKTPLGLIDNVISLARCCRRHPVLVAEALLVAFVPGRASPTRWLGTLWLGAKWFRLLRS